MEPLRGSMGVPGSVKKSETASKVVHSRCVSEVDAKISFSFFHYASVGVSKDLRLFLLFPLRAVDVLHALTEEDLMKAAFKMLTIAAWEEEHFQS
ncbi:hypothetical protein BP422_27445 [Brevibacillus formosus]|uniref:Uncharacterized protein n=1 Tax=Brevibacillus formosus TaxID=54913 RepID=A0A220MP00_9BACL|nr:hypothetical protein BP422_27445 [Brevibacillus formosus]